MANRGSTIDYGFARRIARAMAALLAGAILLLNGCAGGGRTYSVESANTASDPRYVVIGEVIDSREYGSDHRDLTEPSLPPDRIHDPDVRARAFGRVPVQKGSAKDASTDVAALLDASPDVVLLDTPHDVEIAVREAVTIAFSEAGYQVLGDRDPLAARAAPVQVEIVEFWAWFDRDTKWLARMHSRSVVTIKAPIPHFDEPRAILSRRLLRTTVSNPQPRQWRNTVVAAGKTLSRDLAKLLIAAQ